MVETEEAEERDFIDRSRWPTHLIPVDGWKVWREDI